MSTLGDWLKDIGDVADDLGYGIESIDMGRIRLRGRRMEVIDIDSQNGMLSADTLRTHLKSIKPEPKRPIS